jgi:hypothetical protein
MALQVQPDRALPGRPAMLAVAASMQLGGVFLLAANGPDARRSCLALGLARAEMSLDQQRISERRCPVTGLIAVD